jgi:translation initiation factor IF-1
MDGSAWFFGHLRIRSSNNTAGYKELVPSVAKSWMCVLLRGLKTSSSTDSKTNQAPVSTVSEGDAIELEGRVVAVLPGTMFRVQLANGHIVLGHISGKLRKHYIKIAAGDLVKMEMSPYDTNKARITFRMKESESTYRPPARRRY